MKKNILITVAFVLILAVSAVAYAEGALTDDQQEFLNLRTERLEELVNEGKITQEQADAYIEGFEQRLLDGTCQGNGASCTEGEECEFGLGDEGECLGFGSGFANGNYSNGCGSAGANRGCGGR